MPADEKWPAVVEIDDEDEGWKGGGGASPASFSDVEVMTAEEKRAEDDDCCILDCDPSDPVVAVVNRKLAFSCCHGGDDIVVIAEKGQVACKDYPHSRHVCVEYPFDGTPHESYCPQCYCYVCDILAPCLYWKGDADGHCHAFHQEKKWQELREVYLILAKKILVDTD